MPDTGAPWNIPYVAGTDLVRDWPTDSQDLAEAIADGLDEASLIKQVVQTVKNDTTSTTSATFTGVTGMSVSITPTAATSKVLVVYSINIGSSSTGNPPAVRLMRDSTAIFIGTGGSLQNITSYGAVGSTSDIAGRVAVFLDSPATTSATAYSLEWLATGGATVYLNRRGADTSFITASSITAIEVAA